MAEECSNKRKTPVREQDAVKRNKVASVSITYNELGALCCASKHIPQGTPKRWDLISTLVSDCSSSHESPHVILNDSDTTCVRSFDQSPYDCKQVVKILYSKYKGLFDFSESAILNMLHTYTEKSALKSIILLPHAKECCGKPIVIRNRPMFPLVYTLQGTSVAAMFSGECRNGCSNKFYYSYYSHDGNTHFYSLNGKKFFHITSKTIFDLSLLEDVTNNVSISATSFQSRAEVYNENFRTPDSERLKCLYMFGRSLSDGEHPWKLTEKRIEDAWFIYTLVHFYSDRGCLESINFHTEQSVSQRVNVDALCGKAWDVLVESTSNSWIHHKCKIKGCAEGIRTYLV
jgi:hypothetical protein